MHYSLHAKGAAARYKPAGYGPVPYDENGGPTRSIVDFFGRAMYYP